MDQGEMFKLTASCETMTCNGQQVCNYGKCESLDSSQCENVSCSDNQMCIYGRCFPTTIPEDYYPQTQNSLSSSKPSEKKQPMLKGSDNFAFGEVIDSVKDSLWGPQPSVQPTTKKVSSLASSPSESHKR